MMNEPDVDPALFRVWGLDGAYDGGLAVRDDEALLGMAGRAVLDLKSASLPSPLEQLQDMLNGMTRELREQLQQFRALQRREDSGEGGADIGASGQGGDGKGAGLRAERPDPPDRKQVQADAKASIEAMSVIVRTLEKIDSLQRTIDADRRAQAEADLGDEDYAAIISGLEARIEAKAEARAAALIGEWVLRHGKILSASGLDTSQILPHSPPG